MFNDDTQIKITSHTQTCVSVPDDILILNDEYDEIMIITVKIL